MRNIVVFINICCDADNRVRSLLTADDIRLIVHISDHEGELLALPDLICSGKLKCGTLIICSPCVFRLRFARSIPIVFYGRRGREYPMGTPARNFSTMFGGRRWHGRNAMALMPGSDCLNICKMFAFECIPGNHTPPMPWDAQEFIALNFQVDKCPPM